jgi:hypothetical protein
MTTDDIRAAESTVFQNAFAREMTEHNNIEVAKMVAQEEANDIFNQLIDEMWTVN